MLKNRVKNIKFVLVRPRNPNNIGAAARAMANFGFDQLSLVDPYGPVVKEARAAVGAHQILKAARIQKSVAQAISGCTCVVGTSAGTQREKDSRWIEPDQLPNILAGHTRTAFLFGSEKNGLSNTDLDFCQYILRFPTHSKQPSLNLSQAVLLLAYSLRTQFTPPAARKRKPVLTVDQKERIVQNAINACEGAGLFKTWDKRRRERELRQTILKWDLDKKGAAIVQGWLRFIQRCKGEFL